MSTVSAIEVRRREKARKYLRFFLMDTPELNRLIRNYEIDNDRLDFALDMAISDWNSTTPLTRPVSMGNFPSLYLLIHSAACVCLKMAGLYQSRNELTYNSGGTSIIRSNKTPLYQSWISNFQSEFEAKKLNIKIQQNVENSLSNDSGFHSEYFAIGFDW